MSYPDFNEIKRRCTVHCPRCWALVPSLTDAGVCWLCEENAWRRRVGLPRRAYETRHQAKARRVRERRMP